MEAVLDTSRKFSAAIHYSLFKAKGQRLIIIITCVWQFMVRRLNHRAVRTSFAWFSQTIFPIETQDFLQHRASSIVQGCLGTQADLLQGRNSSLLFIPLITPPPKGSAAGHSEARPPHFCRPQMPYGVGELAPLSCPGVLRAALAAGLYPGTRVECHSDPSGHRADGLILTPIFTSSFELTQG